MKTIVSVRSDGNMDTTATTTLGNGGASGVMVGLHTVSSPDGTYYYTSFEPGFQPNQPSGGFNRHTFGVGSTYAAIGPYSATS